ncbi:MAG TPA: sulfatase-like hydrolase/transferase [Halococcus sp.]|nr:sulfatase-like hydrolase/transferase [Halococcus sp.]
MTAMARNVFLLTIDALRADHLSSVGYERETTPNLDGFAAKHCQFTTAFSAILRT